MAHTEWTIFLIEKAEQNFTMDRIEEQSAEMQISTLHPQMFIANR